MSTSTLPTSAGGAARPAGPVRYRESDCRLPEFAALVERAPVLADFPQATDVAQGVLVYDSAALQRAAADGYPFPTNLDLDPNVGGLTPLSQSELLQRVLDEDWDVTRVHAELDAYAARHRTEAI